MVTSVPAGGVNSNVDAGIGARDSFEYVVTMRSPFGGNISVRNNLHSSLFMRISPGDMLLVEPLHRRVARRQSQLISVRFFRGRDTTSGLDILEIQTGRDRGDARIEGRTFA